jgi:hypothetical protein
MSKPRTTYTPLAAHLLRDNVGGHISLFVQLPGGLFIEAAIFPGLTPAIFERFDVVVQPEGAPTFETAQVFTLTPKTTAPPVEKETTP